MIKLVVGGKDVLEQNFELSSSNVKMYIKKDSAYAIEGYVLVANILVPSELLAQSIKSVGNAGIQKQFELFLLMNSGLSPRHFDGRAYFDIGRAKGGMKPVTIQWHFTSPALAWALGVDLNEYSPHGSIETNPHTESLMAECERIILEAKEFRMALDQQCRELANIKNVDQRELWNEDVRFGEAWKTRINELKAKKIAFHKFMN